MVAVVPIVAGVALVRNITEKFSSESDDTSTTSWADSLFDANGCCASGSSSLSSPWFVAGPCANGWSSDVSSSVSILRLLVNAGEALGCKFRQFVLFSSVCCCRTCKNPSS